MDRARGVLPTYVTDREVVLCKIAPRLINTYEIRLGLFMAAQRQLAFVLAVSQECAVAPDVLSHVTRFGGTCRRGDIQEFSVYFGAADASGVELEGWVLGDREVWEKLRAALGSERLRAALVPGAWLEAGAAQEVATELREERTGVCNVDGEPLLEATLALADTVARSRGALFIQ
jgi:hypothetical protein